MLLPQAMFCSFQASTLQNLTKTTMKASVHPQLSAHDKALYEQTYCKAGEFLTLSGQIPPIAAFRVGPKVALSGLRGGDVAALPLNIPDNDVGKNVLENQIREFGKLVDAD